MQSLSPEARTRLAAFNKGQSPDAEDEARVLAALERRLAEPVPRRRVGVYVITALALAAGLVLAVTWAITPARRADDAAVQAPHHDGPQIQEVVRPVPVAPIVPPVPLDTSPTPVPADTSVLPVPSDTSEPPVPADSSASAPSRRPRVRDAGDDIAAEVALLREAKLAEPGRRLELLGEHARRFPGGTFAAERWLLEAETRCALGEVEQARGLVDRFVDKFPTSPLAPRVAKICSDEP